MADSPTETPTAFGFSVLAPRTLSADECQAADQHCDVLVLGYGAAGAASAIAAREAGADVIVADRFGGGGASALSGGVVYAGGGTRQQKHFDYQDTPEAMFQYLKLETGDAVSDATLRRFCEDSVGLIDWLEGMGANFDSTETPPKTSYPNDGIYLYYSGSETAPRFAAASKAAPRGHRARGTWMSGKNLIEHMSHRARQSGVKVLLHSPARRLLQDPNGNVVGAELLSFEGNDEARETYAKLITKAEKIHNFMPRKADGLRREAHALQAEKAKPVTVHARKGVVISSGGFVFNKKMLLDNAPKYGGVIRLGSTGCDGAGIRLGESGGGTTARMDKVSAWRFINPPTNLPRGIVVGPGGERYCNEQVYGARLGVAMCETQQGKSWLILDKALRWQAIKECLFGKAWPFQKYPALILMLFAKRAKTIGGLAEKIGVPADALQKTVERYTSDARAGNEDSQGKSPELLTPIEKAPFYALDISVSNRLFPCPAITLGGLRVNEESGLVLNEANQDIGGLYAAGRSAVGIASNNYVSGLSLADCIWSGRRAGQHAARQEPETIIRDASARKVA